jgi:hypothetical protein
MAVLGVLLARLTLQGKRRPDSKRVRAPRFFALRRATRPRGGSKIPSGLEKKRTSLCRFRAETESRRESLARRVASIAVVTAFWIALSISTVVFIAGIVVVVVRALATRKALKSLKGALGIELKRISAAGEHSTAQLETVTKNFERLQTSLGYFATAQARLRLVNEALSEAQAVVTRARAFIPSK